MTGQLPGFIVTIDQSGFFRATPPSGSSFKTMLTTVDHLREVMEGAECSRLLLDLSRVEPPGLVEQAIFGEHLARNLSHCDKVASLVAHGMRTGTSEHVAQRLNLPLRVFTDEREAIGWLTS